MPTNRYFVYDKKPVNRASPTYAANAAFQAIKTQAADTINLTLGELDISPANGFLERCREKAAGKLAAEPGNGAADTGKGCNYPPAQGTAELRNAGADRFMKDNGMAGVKADDVVVSLGGKAVLNAIGSAFKPGDEVLVAGPGWPTNYDFWRDGVKIVEVDTDGRGLMTAEQMTQALADHPNAKAVLINDPCNPTGARYDAKEREAVMKALKEFHGKHADFIAVIDDPYGALTYGGATMARGDNEKALFNAGGMAAVNSVSKVYARPDMRVGYAVTKNEKLRKEMVAYIQTAGTSVPVPEQNRAQLLLLCGDPFIAETKARLESRARLLAETINAIPGLAMKTPQGAIYGWVDCSGLKGKTVPAAAAVNGKEIVLDDPSKIAEFMRQVARVAPVDGGPFYAPGSPAAKDAYFVRMVMPDEKTIREVGKRLGEAVAKLEPQRAGGKSGGSSARAAAR